MKTSFEVNIRLKDSIIKQQKKKSPAWRRQLPIRIFMWLCLPASIYFVHRYMGELSIDMQIMLGALMWSLVGINYFAISSLCSVTQIRKLAEELELQENEIFYQYRPINEGSGNTHGHHPKIETRIRYSDISKIEYHPYYQMVKVYAPFYYTRFRSYSIPSVKKQGYMQEPGEFRLFYEYFEDFEDFVQGISQRTGLPVTRVDAIVNFENEKKL